ncbi:MAG: hypothetical protein U0263_07745 [Polyangiaceae bacterium]
MRRPWVLPLVAFAVACSSTSTNESGSGGTSTGGTSTGGTSTGGTSTGGTSTGGTNTGGAGTSSGGTNMGGSSGSGGSTAGTGGTAATGGSGGATGQPNGATCGTDPDCTSKHCVGNVCCEVSGCAANQYCAPGSGKCTCLAGWGDCNPQVPGCETDVQTDYYNCGSCGKSCTMPNSEVCCKGTCASLCNPTVCKECLNCNGSEQCKFASCGDSC